MPIINRAAELAEDAKVWRRDFHQHPELLYEVHRTAARVAELLTSFGVDEVVTGIGRTGVVGVIRGREPSPRVIGLRADMDALPLQEVSDIPHKSTIPGRMHACGHDGHTAMLLGAARYLAETRNFAGTAVVIFQPAEEGGAGGRAMVDDGLMERFGIEEVYGLHNAPGLPLGAVSTRVGAVMAAADTFEVRLKGLGGHAARPNKCVDPIIAGAQIVTALQTIVARNVDPVESAVLSITRFHAGTSADNIIPQTAIIGGTVRTLDEEVRRLMDKRFKDLVTAMASGMGVEVEIDYEWGYPVVVNHAEQTAFAARVARDVVGPDQVKTDMPPRLGGEDFAYMLQARPGAFVFMGIGDGAGVHHPEYDFNDDVIPHGISYWAKLVETAMPVG
ncbi:MULTISPECIES: M20 aminoacylase family protein [Bradyrhizobium]|jgi:hippurate hydrolase|uniref:Amidohydrolase n=10 Tax=Bradyrhizobium TaxID=374 RepID=A0ABS5G4N6_9BRAD|nr:MULTISPECIES: M20 aminoacylase family protein [Bradyrhizobium]MBR1136014.1 amidohydrolase [Bradyrhizobium denitrificans]MDU1492228.1 M20 aminoacylase family protein [Bradyrhizobium sp.]MDU1542549.1 M20 aminoacylase family protein [Bradyrhizobium sp.]MDU1803957.1 M20 aminoacylase family protein [Bradyrhizobium sp.]MDU3042015.1 M20 aminoacylase family protein [Bradyrhizobium sp.]